MPARNLKLSFEFACLVLALALILPSSSLGQEGYTPVPVIKGMELLKPGDKAPAFVVKDIEGQTFDFSLEMGKQFYLLVFWSIYCEPCREEMPLVEKVYNNYKGKGLEVFSVNLDGDPFLEAVKGFIKQGKYSFKVLMDELREEIFVIADPYNVAGTPVMYMVNRKGEIAFNILGRVTEDDLKNMIEKAMAAP